LQVTTDEIAFIAGEQNPSRLTASPPRDDKAELGESPACIIAPPRKNNSETDQRWLCKPDLVNILPIVRGLYGDQADMAKLGAERGMSAPGHEQKVTRVAYVRSASPSRQVAIVVSPMGFEPMTP
jgi:hypothetical protein